MLQKRGIAMKMKGTLFSLSTLALTAALLLSKMVDCDCLSCSFPLVKFGNGLTAKRSVSPSPCPDTDCGPLSF